MNNSLILPNNLIYNTSISQEYILQELLLTEPIIEQTSILTSTSSTHVIDVIGSPKLMISSAKEVSVPLNILKHNSSLEAIVCYLKETCNLRFNEIALLLNRDQRTIWVTYANSKRKNLVLYSDAASYLAPDTGHNISLPLNIFTSRLFSVLETIVFYLRTNYALSFNQISDLLGKNYRTIWTVYKRALHKLEENKENILEKNNTRLNNK